MKCLILFVNLLCALPMVTPAMAQPPTKATIHQRMQEFVDQREIAGAVTIVATADSVLDTCVVGQQDIAAGRPMQADSIFWIASMTKPVTGVAVMILEEEGKLKLDDPVSQYLPEFKDLKNSDGESVSVTIKQLLTHSAGLRELNGQESAALKTLSDLTKLVVTKPVQFPAGSKWQYSQTGINTAARIVEVISGKSFPEFIEHRIFAPLGMKDTTFYLTKEQLPRLAKSYKRTDDGQLEEAVNIILFGHEPTSTDRAPMANGGLFSTAADYTRFCQMLLAGGSFQGNQVLKPETVKRFSSVHSGDLKTGFTPGNGWGVGCCIVREPQGVSEHLSAGSFGHGGAFGTQAWIDPVRKRIYVLMVQRANFANSDASPVRAAFQAAAQ
ncbi:MAG: beta-lactamase family protein [Pirellulaceae bacterium]|nr:beta-lactamase family protein [Pirellulaceae bacterium]